MKIPEKPPSIGPFSDEDLQKLLSFSDSEKMRDLIRQANKEYVYWDKFKYKGMPEGVSPQSAWLYLRWFNRKPQARDILVKDKENKPFNFWLPDQVLENLHFIDSFAGGQISLDEPTANREAKEKYLIASVMEEAISSSLLEGAVSTRERAKEMLLSGKKPISHGDRMIYNNFLTIRKLGNLKDHSLSVDLLNDIHREITQETLKDPTTCGRFRTKSDSPIAIMDEQGNVLFEPPSAEEVNQRVAELIQFANHKKEFIHPVIKAIILHFSLAYVHPFVDGNGRTARALFYWYMLKENYWLMEYLSISSIILKAPGQYARAYLYTETDDRDLTYFITFNLRVICDAIAKLKSYIAKKQKEIKTYSDTLRNKFPDLNYRQETLLEHALHHPSHYYSIQNHKNYHGVTYETARKDLLGLAEKRLMEKIQKGRAFYFTLDKEMEKFL